MEQLKLIAEIASCIGAIITTSILLIKPIRKRIFNNSRSIEGEKCLLRSEMLKTYYKNCDTKQVKQYELENFIKLYEAYKSLGGNSFIDEVYDEIREWKIIS